MSKDPANQPSSPSMSSTYKELLVTDEGGVRTIMLNRPTKYNAITFQVLLSVVISTVQYHSELVFACDSYCRLNFFLPF